MNDPSQPRQAPPELSRPAQVAASALQDVQQRGRQFAWWDEAACARLRDQAQQLRQESQRLIARSRCLRQGLPLPAEPGEPVVPPREEHLTEAQAQRQEAIHQFLQDLWELLRQYRQSQEAQLAWYRQLEAAMVAERDPPDAGERGGSTL